MLTPEEVEQKVFSTTRLKEGYVADEVDEFLDGVAEEYRELYGRISRLQDEVNAANRNAMQPTAALPVYREDYAQPEEQLSAESIKSILVAAQAAAERMEADAAAQASILVTEAERKAAIALSNAKVEAEQIIGAATQGTEQRIAELRAEEDRLSHEVSALSNKEAEYRQFLEQALGFFKAALDERPGG